MKFKSCWSANLPFTNYGRILTQAFVWSIAKEIIVVAIFLEVGIENEIPILFTLIHILIARFHVGQLNSRDDFVSHCGYETFAES